MYDYKYILYIDLLGFKDAVYRSVRDEEVEKNIYDTLIEIEKTKKDNIAKKYFYNLSDSVFIVFDGNNNIEDVLWETCKIQNVCIVHKFLVRGMLTIGLVNTNDSKFIYGPGVNEVVLGEQAEKMPRINISSVFIERFFEHFMDKAKYAYDKLDDTFYEYLKYIKDDGNTKWINHLPCQEYFDDIEDVKNALSVLIDENINKESIQSKYEWLKKTYFNMEE